ncbi:MAG: hypothetical protein PHN75_03705 [Syntrophales bacterium]|nr:hypothetical protein [Syntrophales bacterium]
MKRAIAKQAEAERATGQGDQCERRVSGRPEVNRIEAVALMATQPMSLQLRYLQTLNQIAAENNPAAIFPIPIDLFKPFLKFWQKRANGT